MENKRVHFEVSVIVIVFFTTASSLLLGHQTLNRTIALSGSINNNLPAENLMMFSIGGVVLAILLTEPFIKLISKLIEYSKGFYFLSHSATAVEIPASWNLFHDIVRAGVRTSMPGLACSDAIRLVTKIFTYRFLRKLKSSHPHCIHRVGWMLSCVGRSHKHFVSRTFTLQPFPTLHHSGMEGGRGSHIFRWFVPIIALLVLRCGSKSLYQNRGIFRITSIGRNIVLGP
jgi:hypothetical protein